MKINEKGLKKLKIILNDMILKGAKKKDIIIVCHPLAHDKKSFYGVSIIKDVACKKDDAYVVYLKNLRHTKKKTFYRGG